MIGIMHTFGWFHIPFLFFRYILFLLFVLFPFRILSFIVFWLLAYVCCACRTQYDGMILPCLMHYSALSLCRSL